MKSLVFFCLIAAFSAAAIAADLPRLKKYEDYESVRTKMIKAGWKPFHSQNADKCSEIDSRCKGRPEMEICAGTGAANCRFLWIKNDKKKAICTVGQDPAVFNTFC